MKQILLTALLLIAIACNAAPLKGKWVYWYEVNHSGQKIMQVGKVLSKDAGTGTYRIEVAGEEKWKMHLSADKLTVIKK